MAKLLPGGFQELTPDKQIIENAMKDIIRKNYENYWFVNIETPAVESTNVLTAKGWDEVGKQIFWLYGLKQWAEDLKNYSLHFDLTVPFARYVVDNEEYIKFPFKRYQIQKVWRWERQQKWRFKEFTQCDIDVIGNKLPLAYDSEIITALYMSLAEIFNFLRIDKKVEVHLNNKKFIEAICEKYNISGEEKKSFFALLDNYYKLEKDTFSSQLEIISGKNFADIQKLLCSQIESLPIDDDILSPGIDELKQVYFSLKNKWVNVLFDPYITRGLDYYTGTVFETFIEGNFDFGSVCSGGRYDNLVESVKKLANNGKAGPVNYAGVGGSIGLSRLFSRLLDSGFLNIVLPQSDVIFFQVPWCDMFEIEKLAQKLRNNGIKTDIYFVDEKIQKQITYAMSKNIPLAILMWEEENQKNEVVVKNLEERSQENISLEKLVEYLQSKKK